MSLAWSEPPGSLIKLITSINKSGEHLEIPSIYGTDIIPIHDSLNGINIVGKYFIIPSGQITKLPSPKP